MAVVDLESPILDARTRWMVLLHYVNLAYLKRIHISKVTKRLLAQLRLLKGKLVLLGSNDCMLLVSDGGVLERSDNVVLVGSAHPHAGWLG